ncbi:MAG: hypothetical protein U0X73_17120 [Thermoanaerobaculia bacterium]
MRPLRVLLTVVFFAGAVAAFGWFFVRSLGGGGERTVGPASVVFTPPEGYRLAEGGELERPAAARRLAEMVAGSPGEARLGLHFTSAGSELYWLIDRTDPAAERLVERSAGASGTRLETVYRGDVGARLAWAAARGRLDPPGAAAGETRNLYH